MALMETPLSRQWSGVRGRWRVISVNGRLDRARRSHGRQVQARAASLWLALSCRERGLAMAWSGLRRELVADDVHTEGPESSPR